LAKIFAVGYGKKGVNLSYFYIGQHDANLRRL